jgi:hypothetical protein
VKLSDTVLDPCAGTGGFLIAAMYEAQAAANANRTGEEESVSWQQTVDQMKNQLYGFEVKPLTAALGLANMVRYLRCTLRRRLLVLCVFFCRDSCAHLDDISSRS